MRGYLGFTASRSPLSWAIRLATGSPVSHGFVGVDEPDGIVEALPGGVVRGRASRYYAARYRLLLFRPVDPGPGVEEGLAAVAGLIGKRYGYLQVVGTAGVLVARAWGRAIRNPARRGLICSEVQWVYLHHASPSVVAGLGRNDVTPGDLLRRVGASSRWEAVDVL